MKDLTDLTGRRVIVTGAAHGMGAGHVAELARRGARIAALDIDTQTLGRTVDAILAEHPGAEILPLAVDMADDASVRAAVAQAAETFGGLDAVVSNAGTIHSGKGLLETEDAEWHRSLAVHVSGALYLARASVPHLKESGSGRIVIVSSTFAKNPPGHSYGYCASKGALLTMARNMAVELGPMGICVTSIEPGAIDTRMSAELDEAGRAELEAALPARRMGTPEDVALLVCFLISEATGFLTGESIAIHGGE